MAVDTLMQVREAARYLGIHENTLRRWEENGLVRAIRLPSGVRRFRVDEVERLREEIYGGPGTPSARDYHDAVTASAAERRETSAS